MQVGDTGVISTVRQRCVNDATVEKFISVHLIIIISFALMCSTVML